MGILKKLKTKKTDETPEKDAVVKAEKAPAKKAEKKTDAKKKATTAKKTEKKTEEKTEAVAKPTVTAHADAYSVLVRPMLTEKTARQEQGGVYSFVVNNDATKVDVKRAVKQVYGVTPVKVRMMNMEGKRLRFRYSKGMRKSWKKAIVTLPKGQTITIHEGV